MKTKILLIVGVLLLFNSCGLEDAGKTDCGIDLEDQLYDLESQYSMDMVRPDSEGNDQSLEACLNRRHFTENYIIHLQDANAALNDIEGCTDAEYFEFRGQILERKQDLEEDMVSTWNRCEEVFGDGE